MIARANTCPSRLLLYCMAAISTLGPGQALAFRAPDEPTLADFDLRRNSSTVSAAMAAPHEAAANRLKTLYPDARVGTDDLLHRPVLAYRQSAFLTGTNGSGSAISSAALNAFPDTDPHRVIKAFLDEHAALFGHNSSALNGAALKQDYVTDHNGLRTTIWEQEFSGIPVFEAVLKAHLTRSGELVNIFSRFLPQPGLAAKPLSKMLAADEAMSIASRLAGLTNEPGAFSGRPEPGAKAGNRQVFTGPGLAGEAEAALTWLPTSGSAMRLCWNLLLTPKARGETFRLLVDAETGQVWLRRCLTVYISAATYNVFTNDSPSPLTPGWSTPLTNQPPVVPRTLVTFGALVTNASPNGWINDGGNTTVGNNVDAHLDRNGDNIADPGSQPTGSPNRVFNFPIDFASQPTNSGAASVVQLFYLCNLMHDNLYQLGFTEAAGNFQTDNFGRGGLGGDALQADGMDGSGYNNSNMTTPPDGSAPRLQMLLFNGPATNRDSDLDAEIVLHEYTHGLSWRLVGGGVGISSLQTGGMGEGWSDFYALSMLGSPADDPAATYPMSGYVSYLLRGLTQNYYFGIRRYPYSTDMTKNPLTIDDLTQSLSHLGIPRSPIFTTTAQLNPAEVHNQGEVWCSLLWEVRASLIAKLGYALGNQLVLQLVTDGMKLGPAEPNYVEARDAILQAELVDCGGTNRVELWHAFAKRGLGYNAWSPSSAQTAGLISSFDSDSLRLTPASPTSFSGPVGGPFWSACRTLTITNTAATPSSWVVTHVQPWLSVAPAVGSSDPNTTSNLTVCLSASANALAVGSYNDTLTLSNQTSGLTVTRQLTLDVLSGRTVMSFALDTDPGWTRAGQWGFGKPAGAGGPSGAPDPLTGDTGTNVFGVNLAGNYSTTIGGPYYLTAGPLNFSGITNLNLVFSRWLNSDSSSFVSATLAVSTNGTTWTNLWNFVGDAVNDDAWTRQHYDLSSIADNRAAFYVRWGYQILKTGAYPYSGWNIDDVQFIGMSPPPVANNATLVVSGDLSTNLILTGSGAGALTFQSNTAPQHGLLSGLNPVTGAFTYTPARGFVGGDSFTFHLTDLLTNSAPATVTLGVAAPPDSDADGLPDYWEQLYFGNVTNADAAADPDHDGMSNLLEYLAGTNPTNASSVLLITNISVGTNGHATFAWPSVGGVRYRVQFADGLTGAPPALFTNIVRPLASEMDPAAPGTPSTQSFTDDFSLTGSPQSAARYYRLLVTP